MNITLKPDASYPYIRNLFPYYLYDMSEYTGWAPNEEGSYNPEDANLDLQDYWSRPDHEAFLIMADDEIAGFSLIRPYPESEQEYDIGQFYVLRKFKRRGVGQRAFIKTVQQHPGKWLTRVLPDNTGAMSFWRRVIEQNAVAGSITMTTEFHGATEMLFIRYQVT